MTLGVFGARADHRGLSSLTGIMCHHLQPDKVVVVDMGRHSPTAFHPDEYPDAEVVAYDSLLAGDYDLAPFLDGLDTVLTFEIPYDARLYDEAHKRGVKSVVLAMPELDPWARPSPLSRPDVIALPTPWLADRYPPDTPILPIPAEPWAATLGNLVVHPAALAMRDRNGTRTVLEASMRTRHPVVVRAQQTPESPHYRARVEVADLPTSADLYADAALVVLPRRYGGLSLTLQEAMSAGLPVIVSEADPYAAWLPPEAAVSAVRGRDLRAKGGSIPTWNCDPMDLAARIDAVMGDEGLWVKLAEASAVWAAANTWPNVRAAWDAVLCS